MAALSLSDGRLHDVFLVTLIAWRFGIYHRLIDIELSFTSFDAVGTTALSILPKTTSGGDDYLLARYTDYLDTRRQPWETRKVAQLFVSYTLGPLSVLVPLAQMVTCCKLMIFAFNDS
ncbi:unnamed protein product [Protopolystoma xenopodis]|uniref:Uncharacterized protein n=1 Tax=Protopolystoma xenopodis TaxID=117903 RepID=A0A448XDR5_9PLAT|nr:unnamed protein product [Protopolystoma xenopodis]